MSSIAGASIRTDTADGRDTTGALKADDEEMNESAMILCVFDAMLATLGRAFSVLSAKAGRSSQGWW